MFPNPVTHRATVRCSRFTDNGPTTFEIVDIAGRVRDRHPLALGELSYEFNTAPFPAGQCVVVVGTSAAGSAAVGKFVIER